MKLRHILEYEDHEIQDLLGSLERVGQADKRTYALWVSFPGFEYQTGYSGRITLRVALGNPFWSRGDLERDKPTILASLKAGDFTRPEKAGLDWKTLVGKETDSFGRSRKYSQDAIKFLDTKSLQQFFSEAEGDLDHCLLKLAIRVESINGLKAQVGIVYGESNDPELKMSPEDAMRQTANYTKFPVFCEDLTHPEASEITYPLG
jgi:hypothetical protein